MGFWGGGIICDTESLSVNLTDLPLEDVLSNAPGATNAANATREPQFDNATFASARSEQRLCAKKDRSVYNWALASVDRMDKAPLMTLMKLHLWSTLQ